MMIGMGHLRPSASMVRTGATSDGGTIARSASRKGTELAAAARGSVRRAGPPGGAHLSPPNRRTRRPVMRAPSRSPSCPAAGPVNVASAKIPRNIWGSAKARLRCAILCPRHAVAEPRKALALTTDHAEPPPGPAPGGGGKGGLGKDVPPRGGGHRGVVPRGLALLAA